MPGELEEKVHVLHVQAHQEFLEALVESETRYRRLLDGLNDIVFELDQNLGIEVLSQAWVRQTGRGLKDAIRQPLLRFIAEEDRERGIHFFHSATDGVPCVCELRLVDAQNQKIWFLLTVTPTIVETRRTWFGSMANIQARKLAEAERDRHRHALEAIARAQASYIGSTAFGEVIGGLIEEIRAITQSKSVFLEVLPSAPLIRLERTEWVQSKKDWFDMVSTELLASDTGETIFFSKLAFPAPLNNACILPLRSGKHLLGWLLLDAPSPISEETAKLLRALTLTTGQILRAEDRQLASQLDQQQLDRLSKVASQTSNGVVITDLQGRVQWVNEGFSRMTGYTLDDMLGCSPGDILQGQETSATTVTYMRQAIQRYQPFHTDVVNYRKSGEPYHVRISCNPMLDNEGNPIGFIAIQSDITREKEWAEQLLKSNQQKEVLLQEIHHRVKNNLQIVSSLLNMQKENSPVSFHQPLEESIHRIRSMALVHQSLYGTTSLDRVDMGEYARNLISSLTASLGPSVRAQVEVEAVEVPIQLAVPLGLILNELLTNALKYAMREGNSGGNPDLIIRIEKTDSQLSCTVTDFGPGMPQGFEVNRSRTLGMRLVWTLFRQLRAQFHYQYQQGSCFTITCSTELD